MPRARASPSFAYAAPGRVPRPAPPPLLPSLRHHHAPCAHRGACPAGPARAGPSGTASGGSPERRGAARRRSPQTRPDREKKKGAKEKKGVRARCEGRTSRPLRPPRTTAALVGNTAPPGGGGRPGRGGAFRGPRPPPPAAENLRGRQRRHKKKPAPFLLCQKAAPRAAGAGSAPARHPSWNVTHLQAYPETRHAGMRRARARGKRDGGDGGGPPKKTSEEKRSADPRADTAPADLPARPLMRPPPASHSRKHNTTR
jgi:hypothetical protein